MGAPAWAPEGSLAARLLSVLRGADPLEVAELRDTLDSVLADLETVRILRAALSAFTGHAPPADPKSEPRPEPAPAPTPHDPPVPSPASAPAQGTPVFPPTERSSPPPAPGPRKRKPKLPPHEKIRRVAEEMERIGRPCKVRDIVAGTGIIQPIINLCLRHPWFVKCESKGLYRLSEAYHAERRSADARSPG